MVSRVHAITDGSTGQYAVYSYLGAGAIVSVTEPLDAQTNLTLNYNYSGSNHTYEGWDRFGRVIAQTWKINQILVDAQARRAENW